MTKPALVNQQFFLWLDHALLQHIPEKTVAFHFNLYEGTDSVHMQLIGTDSFALSDDSTKDYWPGNETFTTGENVFEVPFETAGEVWTEWLKTTMHFVSSYITNGGNSNLLRASKGVGIGFVDGDLHILWKSAA